MPAFPLLWPTIAMAALTFAIWFALFFQRMRHMRANPPTADTFGTAANARDYFEPVERPAANLANLFEMPVLFYTIVILLLFTELANDIQVVLAWMYVGARAVHSIFHLRGQVRARFLSYLASMIVLLAMWIGFTVDTMSAARAYQDTVATLDGAAP